MQLTLSEHCAIIDCLYLVPGYLIIPNSAIPLLINHSLLHLSPSRALGIASLLSMSMALPTLDNLRVWTQTHGLRCLASFT